jgi:hypothetical protein
MAAKTPAKLLHEALVGILQGGAARLAIDARSVAVQSFLPDQGMSQKRLPLVVVTRPRMTGEEPWGRDYTMRTYGVSVLLVDGVRPVAGDVDEGMERLDLLAERVRGVIQEDGNQNLQLAYLHVFRSLCDWVEGEAADAGNNLVVKAMELSVPMTVERGKVWGDAEVVLVLGSEDGDGLATEDGLALEIG